MGDDNLRSVARRLRDLVEPVAANVYFAPEAHAAYEALGVEGFGPGYFSSRGGCLGDVPGEVVAAAFGVFKPAMVKECVDAAHRRADAHTMVTAREQGAVASLTRIFGDDPAVGAAIPRATELLQRAAAATPPGEGRALYSGLTALGDPGTPIGDLWRACDLVREHRGDSHIIAWVGHGLDPIQANISTELWWRLPLRSYVRTRGWTEDEIDAALEDLRDRGLVAGDSFTEAGEQLRADIELCTDRQEHPIVDALGDDAEELLTLLTPMADAVIAAKGYPRDPRTFTRP
jgi:Helix-turn-helix family